MYDNELKRKKSFSGIRPTFSASDILERQQKLFAPTHDKWYLWKVSLKILNSGIILETFTYVFIIKGINFIFVDFMDV